MKKFLFVICLLSSVSNVWGSLPAHTQSASTEEFRKKFQNLARTSTPYDRNTGKDTDPVPLFRELMKGSPSSYSDQNYQSAKRSDTSQRATNPSRSEGSYYTSSISSSSNQTQPTALKVDSVLYQQHMVYQPQNMYVHTYSNATRYSGSSNVPPSSTYRNTCHIYDQNLDSGDFQSEVMLLSRENPNVLKFMLAFLSVYVIAYLLFDKKGIPNQENKKYSNIRHA